jgi:hypothetical protein
MGRVFSARHGTFEILAILVPTRDARWLPIGVHDGVGKTGAFRSHKDSDALISLKMFDLI